MSGIADTFRDEAGELLLELEDALLALEENPDEAGPVARVFRALHTLKGAGGLAGSDQQDLRYEIEERDKKMILGRSARDLHHGGDHADTAHQSEKAQVGVGNARPRQSPFFQQFGEDEVVGRHREGLHDHHGYP